MKEFFKEKKVHYYLMCGTFICILLHFIFYLTKGANEYNKMQTSTLVYVLDIISLVLTLGLFVKEIRFGKYIVYLLMLLSSLTFAVYEANFIANVFVATDPVNPEIMSNFILLMVTGFLSWIIMIVSAFMQRKREWKGEAK